MKNAIRLISPFVKHNVNDEYRKVQAWVPPEVYDYIFRGVLAGFRGAQDSIVGTFVYRLHQEIVKENIPPHYDPENESRVANIMLRLNFNPQPVPGCPADPAPGDTTPRPKSRRTPGVRGSVSNKKDKPADLQGSNSGGKRRAGKKSAQGQDQSGGPERPTE